MGLDLVFNGVMVNMNDGEGREEGRITYLVYVMKGGRGVSIKWAEL